MTPHDHTHGRKCVYCLSRLFHLNINIQGKRRRLPPQNVLQYQLLTVHSVSNHAPTNSPEKESVLMHLNKVALCCIVNLLPKLFSFCFCFLCISLCFVKLLVCFVKLFTTLSATRCLLQLSNSVN